MSEKPSTIGHSCEESPRPLQRREGMTKMKEKITSLLRHWLWRMLFPWYRDETTWWGKG